MVQPHKKPDQNSCPKPNERAIHDLVLLKAITAKDKPNPDTTTVPDAPPEARVLLCSILADDPELFKIYPEECLTHAPMINADTSPEFAPIMPQNDATFLQTSADALLHKIQQLRREEPHALNPKAPPFTPLPNPNSTTDLCLMVTTAEIQPQPKEVRPNTRKKPQPIFVSPTKVDQSSQPKMENPDIHQIEEQPPNIKKVRWKPELSIIHDIEAEGEQKPTSATLRQQKEHAAKKRSWCTNRSRRYRDQLDDWVITLHQLQALNTHSEPHCPSPRLILHKPKRTILQNPNRQKSISPPKRIPKGNAKPLTRAGKNAQARKHASRTFFRISRRF